MASGPITSWPIDGETVETVSDFIFWGSNITADGDCSHEIKRCLLLGRKVMTNLDSIIKKQRHYFANKGPSSHSYGFPSSRIWMWELDYKENWVPKNWFFWTVVWGRLLRVPWTAGRSNQSILKEIIGWSLGVYWNDWCWSWNSNTWPPDAKNWLIGKDLDAGKDWGQEEKQMTEDEMIGWHHQLNGHEFG